MILGKEEVDNDKVLIEQIGTLIQQNTEMDLWICIRLWYLVTYSTFGSILHSDFTCKIGRDGREGGQDEHRTRTSVESFLNSQNTTYC